MDSPVRQCYIVCARVMCIEFFDTFAVPRCIRTTYRYRIFHTFKCVLWPWKKYHKKIEKEELAWRQCFRVEVVTDCDCLVILFSFFLLLLFRLITIYALQRRLHWYNVFVGCRLSFNWIQLNAEKLLFICTFFVLNVINNFIRS